MAQTVGGQSSEYGGFWIRVLAAFVDSAILWIASIIIIVLCAFAGSAGALLGAVLPFLLMLLYYPLMHASARQATFGKALLGLKVARADDGGRISILRALGRDILGKFVSSLVLMLGFLMAAFTGRKQALHDKLASTVVVRDAPGHLVAALAVTIFSFVAPVVFVMLLGAGAVVGMMGVVGGALFGAMVAEQAKQAPKPAAPAAPSAAAAPAPQAAPATPPAAPTAAPAPAVAPAPVAAATVPQPAPAPAAKPAAAPAPEPVKPAAAPVPEKPVASAPVEEAPKPKPAPRKRAAVPKPAVAPGSAAAAPAAAPTPSGPRVVAPPKYSDLMSAVLARDAAGVQELLDFGKWADKPDRRGTTPLMIAVSLGDGAIAEALLKAGANGGKAVSVAQEKGDKAMLALLQRYGATLPRP